MNWQHLIYFRKVVENDSFSKTAEQLFITPSALSKAIHSLESEVGVELFEKKGRVSVLTRYGHEFYPYVCKAIDSVEEGLSAIDQELKEKKGHVRIGGVFSQCTTYLPPLMKDFNEIYRNISFSISYELSGTVLKQVLDGDLDLGLTGDFDFSDRRYQDIEAQLLSQEELVIIVPEDHPLAGEEYIDFSKLGDYQFIFWKNVNSGLNKFTADLCKQHGLDSSHSYEAYDDPTMIAFVENGMGIGLIPDIYYLENSKVRKLKFPVDPPSRSLYLVWKKKGSLSAPAKLFRDYVLDGIPQEA